MMRVRILKQTRYKQRAAWSGAELEVPEKTAALWVERGIAVPLDVEVDGGEPNRRRSRKAAESEE
jgi:hypothetical protein